MKRKRTVSKKALESTKQHAKCIAIRRPKPTPRVDPLVTTFDTRQMKGDLPPFNDWGQFVVDHDRQTIYTYGGYRPHVDSPTADFFSCDMGTLKWKNLTHSLKYHRPYDPFSKEGIKPKHRQLPRLNSASCTFFHLNGGNFVFLFGGYDDAKDRVTSDLIAIDVDSLTWWYVELKGGPINDRIHHSLVAIGNRIYVFGGKKQFDDRAPSFASYSIAEYSSDDGEWSWVTCDHPYPLHVPSLGFGGQAVAVYGGKKILLTPGRLRGADSTIDLSSGNLVFFHTENHTFHVSAQNAGNLPREVSWYQDFSVTPSPGKSRRSSRHEASTSSIKPSPFVILSTWLPRPDNYVALELWQYFLPPEERISCLQLRGKLWDLDLDLQVFVAVGSRLFLLGYEAPQGARPRDATFNICTEIILAGSVVHNKCIVKKEEE